MQPVGTAACLPNDQTKRIGTNDRCLIADGSLFVHVTVCLEMATADCQFSPIYVKRKFYFKNDPILCNIKSK